jgi:hypothetical protein
MNKQEYITIPLKEYYKILERIQKLENMLNIERPQYLDIDDIGEADETK